MKLPINSLRIGTLIVFLLIISSKCELSKRNVSCKSNYSAPSNISNFFFECLISLTFEIADPNTDTKVDCQEIDPISLFVNTNNLPIQNSTFICSSSCPIYSEATFDRGIINKAYLSMKSERVAVDISNVSTYIYNLNIFPPSNIPEESILCNAVKYSLISICYPTEKIDVLWYSNAFSKLCWFGPIITPEVGLSLKDTYSKGLRKSIQTLSLAGAEVNEVNNVAVIPCVIPYGDRKIGHRGQNYSADNKTISYHPIHGFKLNTSNVNLQKNSLFICLASKAKEYSTEFRFVIKEELNVTVSTDINVADMSPVTTPFILPMDTILGKTKIMDYKGHKFTLQCSSKFSNVTIDDFTKFKSRMQVNFSNDVLTNTNTSVKYVTPVLNFGEQKFYYCRSSSGKLLGRVWHISRIDIKSDSSHRLTYDGDENNYLCFSTSMDVDLRQLYCENVHSCMNLAGYLKKPDSKQGIQFGSKMEKLLNDESKAIIFNNYDPNFISFYGQNIKPLKKGLIQCSVNVFEDLIYQDIYFLGMDNKHYLGVSNDIEDSAILKIKTKGEIGTTWPVPGHFKFYCEASSFHFDDGLLWYWSFINGTSDIISKGNIAHTDWKLENADVSNPSSSVEITLEDSTIKSIICVAPLQSILDINNLGKWRNISVNVSLSPTIPATISSDLKVKYIRVGDDQGLVCKAEGFPVPYIEWGKADNTEMENVVLVDQIFQKTLQFPIYNEKHAGEYKCTAFNEAGNVTKYFTVVTDVRQKTTLLLSIILPTIALVIVTLIFTSLFLMYKRRMRKKRYFEMKEIRELLHGRKFSSETSEGIGMEESENGILYNTRYDESYELEKHTFHIDPSKFLGKGEFGIVYKGRMAKVDDDVAFKTINCSSSMTHLKSLVSELKILIYIGKHENIVQLLGAFTKELEKGTIYVAIEFCGLGSLESYLRSNKGRFLKCPFLISYYDDGYSNTTQEFKKTDESTNHSIKTLLKWCNDVATAMEFLGQRNVLHSDLAARNVLLTVDFIAKVTDFGLSRKMYATSEYWKKGQDPLPWRWLAIESLQSKVFSVKTDVWSYGITLWEIFSLGEVPYPGVSPSITFVAELEKGIRNCKPKYASNALHDVMIKCWHLDPAQRPTFTGLKLLFQNTLLNDKFVSDLKDLDVTTNSTDIEYLEI